MLDDLPTELILHIFGYLNIHDRRFARCVSKRWNELLNLPEFTKHEVLKLHSGYLDTVITEVLAKSEKKFVAIEIGTDLGFRNAEESVAALTEIGKFTKTLTLSFYHEYDGFAEIRQCFPNINELTTRTLSLTEILRLYEYTLPESLRKLHCRGTENVAEIYENNYLEALRKVTHLTADYIWLSKTGPEYADLFQMSSDVSKEIENGLNTIAVGNFNLRSTQVLEIEDVKTIHFPYFHNQEFLASTLLKFVSLEYISFHSNDTTGCFFLHKCQMLPKIKKVAIFQDDQLPICQTCLQTLRTCCSNAVDWSISSFLEVDYKEFSQLFYSSKRLEFTIMSIKLFTSQPAALEEVQPFQNLEYLDIYRVTDFSVGEWSRWPPMTHLKKLKLSFVSLVSLNESFAPLVAATPNLEDFAFEIGDVNLENLEIMIRGWWYLQILRIPLQNPIDENGALEILKLSKHLRYLEFYDFITNDFLVLRRRVFEVVPTLRKFGDYLHTIYNEM